MRNRLRRQQELESQHNGPQIVTSNNNIITNNGKRRPVHQENKLDNKMSYGSGKYQSIKTSTSKRRNTTNKSSTLCYTHTGKGASFRNRTMVNNNNLNKIFSPPTIDSDSTQSNVHSSSSTASTFTSDNNSSSASSNKNQAGAAINAYNIFQEPSAYSLDILLSENCDAFFESGNISGNGFISSYSVPQSDSGFDEWLSNSDGNSADDAINNTQISHDKQLMHTSKKCDFLHSIEGDIVDPNGLNSALNDCCNLFFSNSMTTMDLFDNENEIDSLTFSGSNSRMNDCNNESNQSPIYENQSISGSRSNGPLASDLIEIKKDLLNDSDRSVTTSHITSNVTSTGSNSTFEYTRSANDFTQYLLHDNDPTFNLTMNPTAVPTSSNNVLLNSETSAKMTDYSTLNDNLNSQTTHNSTKNATFNTAWDGSNALQLINSSYAANTTSEVYASKSKVPTLVKMTSPMVSASNPVSNDFISTCLISSNDQIEDSCNYDPVIEFVPRIGTDDAIFREIGLSNRELILPERCLLKELTDACNVLKNPYKRILVFNNYDSVRSCRITEYTFHRLIRMSKRLSRFSQLPLSDQANMLKLGLLEMLAIRSVLVYNPDRESWGFIDVSIVLGQTKFKKL